MILWTRRAEKDLAELPEKLQARVATLVGQLDENPSVGTKLKGKLQGKRSARLGRAHRILYQIDGTDVVILTIGQRKDVYR